MYASRFFIMRRSRVKSLLKASESTLNINHYVRLIALSSCDIVIGLPVAVYLMVFASQRLVAWESWDRVHAGWSRVVVYTDNDILPSTILSVYHFLQRWIPACLSIAAFLFFGVGDEATREYGRWWTHVTRKLGFRTTRKNYAE